jgi:hypothetical protein
LSDRDRLGTALTGPPGLFEQSGSSVGTDGTGARAQALTFLVTAPMIGGASFGRHKVAAPRVTTRPIGARAAAA